MEKGRAGERESQNKQGRRVLERMLCLLASSQSHYHVYCQPRPSHIAAISRQRDCNNRLSIHQQQVKARLFIYLLPLSLALPLPLLQLLLLLLDFSGSSCWATPDSDLLSWLCIQNYWQARRPHTHTNTETYIHAHTARSRGPVNVKNVRCKWQCPCIDLLWLSPFACWLVCRGFVCSQSHMPHWFSSLRHVGRVEIEIEREEGARQVLAKQINAGWRT